MNSATGNRRNLATFHRAYPTKGEVPLILVSSNSQILLHGYSLYNANSASSDVGLGLSFNNASWKFLTFVGGVAVDGTAAVQAGTAVNLFTLVNGEGFLIEGKNPFGYLVFNISQAQTGSPTYVYEYYNGTTWATLTPMQVASYSATGYTYVTFNPPVDWVASDGGLTTLGWYAIRIRATVAPTQIVKANSIRVSKWLYYIQSLAASSRLLVTMEDRPYLMEGSEYLSPFFSVAYIQNTVEASYQVAP